jgi:hypothetical protein
MREPEFNSIRARIGVQRVSLPHTAAFWWWFLLPLSSLPFMVPLLSNQPMPADRESLFVEATLPSLPGSDRRGVIEQPVLLLLLGEPGEPGMERVVGRQERLLAMEDGRVRAVRIVVAVELARAERQLDAAEQGRMRVGLEVGINQVRNFPRMPMQLDQVRPLDRAQIRPCAALVNPQQRLERVAVHAVIVKIEVPELEESKREA